VTLNILNRENATRHLGAAFRRSRPGPEQDLVDAFLKELPFSAPRGCNTTIFCEPRLESGFPDLVIVFWNVAVTKKWVPARSVLRREDIQLIHYLHQSGPASTNDLSSRLLKPVSANLARLEAANLVSRAGVLWKPRPIANSFAAKRIIAIEAKMSEWTRAIRQAFQNTWFASDSFVLWPRERTSEKAKSVAHNFGVKLCSPGIRLAYDDDDSSNNIPRSYVSWLFNEWVWRSTQS